MNERIRELAEQAGFFPERNWDHTGWHAAGHNDTFEKFAELIIAECCVALHPMLRDMISRTQGVDMIVEHFRNKE